MAYTSTLLAAATLFLAGAQAGKTCQTYTIAIEPQYNLTNFNYPRWANNYELTNFVTSAVAYDAPKTFLPVVMAGSYLSHKKFNIAATFCQPTGDQSKAKTVLVATHGLGFDQFYWNSAYNPGKYNFVDFVTNQGYSVFIYDRLGTGASTKVSGYTNQGTPQVAVLKALTEAIRAGKYTGNVGTPSHVLHVGHSFGSAVSHNFAVNNPSLTDGIILTGIDFNMTIQTVTANLLGLQPRIARLAMPSKFGKLDTGYLGNVDIYAFQNDFFKAPYDAGALAYTYANSQPFAIMELLTMSSLIVPATGLTVPVQIVSAENDFFFCTGDCNGVTRDAAATLYSNSRAFNFYQVGKSGHGINFSNNATMAYNAITSFVRANFS